MTPWVLSVTLSGILFMVGFVTGSISSTTEAVMQVTETVTTTETVTAEPVPTTTEETTPEPSPTPTETEAPGEDLGERVSRSIEEGMRWAGERDNWSTPILEIETVFEDIVKVHYNRTMTEGKSQDIGRTIINFTASDVPELKVVIVRDATGMERNTYKES